MANSLLNLVDNPAEAIHNIKWKYGHDNTKCEASVIKHRNCERWFEYTNVKDDLTLYKCFCCHTN